MPRVGNACVVFLVGVFRITTPLVPLDCRVCLLAHDGLAILHAKETFWIARTVVRLLLPFVRAPSHASHLRAHPSLGMFRATGVPFPPPLAFARGHIFTCAIGTFFSLVPTSTSSQLHGPPTSTPFLPIEIFGRSHRDLWGWDRYESGGRIDTNGDVWRRRVDESVGDVRRWRRWSASWTA